MSLEFSRNTIVSFLVFFFLSLSLSLSLSLCVSVSLPSHTHTPLNSFNSLTLSLAENFLGPEVPLELEALSKLQVLDLHSTFVEFPGELINGFNSLRKYKGLL